MSSPRIYTVGHSTRALDEFLALLEAHGVTGLADVRSFPGSRRHPHFSREALERSLPAGGIVYRHFAALGGMRKPRRDSRNGGWRHASFRGYADHMETAEFQEALDGLLGFAQSHVVGIMCAEAKWWQCHRQLTSDALVARGAEVRHIMSKTPAPPHELTSFARLAGDRVTYPALLEEPIGGDDGLTA
jgi:uncharacterized protein (DUF488 family)